jgi:hypothetical protein
MASVLARLRIADPTLFRDRGSYQVRFQSSDRSQPIVVSRKKRIELQDLLESWLKNPDQSPLSMWEIQVNLICIQSGLSYRKRFYFNPLAFDLRKEQFVPFDTPGVYKVKLNPSIIGSLDNWRKNPHRFHVLLSHVAGSPYGLPGCFKKPSWRSLEQHATLMQQQVSESPRPISNIKRSQR